MNINKFIPLLFATTLLAANIAFADLAPLPEEEACAELMSGDACSFISMDGEEEVTGTCQEGICSESAEEPEAGEEMPEAGEEMPEAGEEMPEAGEEVPEAGEESGEEAAESSDSEDEGCDQSSSRNQNILLALFALIGLVTRRRVTNA